MGQKCTTGRSRVVFGLLAAMVFAGPAWAQRPQSVARKTNPDWRRIGNSAFDLALPSVATGPVERVWYSPDGSRLFARTASGRTFESADFEGWKPVEGLEPPALPEATAPARLPEQSAKLRPAAGNLARAYAVGQDAWRSDDGGLNWHNLTAYRQRSILGERLSDLAVSPANPDELVAANPFGVWRSVDGGLSWTGLNSGLPNLPVKRIAGLPGGSRGARLLLEDVGGAGPVEVQWPPGERLAWRPTPNVEYAQELGLRRQLSTVLGAEITAVGLSGAYLYAGSADGQLWASPDQGQTWPPPFSAGGGSVESIWIETSNPRVALAALGGKTGPHVLRTISGGSYWRDLTANLGEAAAHRLAAERATGAVYAATENGLFYTFANLLADGPATPWVRLGENLPQGAIRDVALDAAGNQLFVAVEGYGVYVAIAPHRFADLRVVSAADFSERPAAPGALLSVLGGRISNARSGELPVPVLNSSEMSSQLQVPFEAAGDSLPLAVEAAGVWQDLGLPLRRVSPAIFVDPEGAPFLIDSDSGVMVSSMSPARSGARVQILAAGLGRVRPDWPTGLAAPIDNPPQVVADLRAYLDRLPLAVKRATLAPGYIGFYLVEVELPDVVNIGPADLYIEAGGQASNHVQAYLEP